MTDKVLIHTDGKGLDYYASGEKKLGLLHVITGPGKGKTTSSIGLTVRATGAGFDCLFIQFFKKTTNELEPLEQLGVETKQFQFLGPFFKDYSEEEFEEMQDEFMEFWNEIRPSFSDYDLVVLDEMVYVVTEGVFAEDEFVAFLDDRPPDTELVLTGRDFPDAITERADYVSRVEKDEHPFERGVPARKGIEF
jgi:cob(I)alamin adenosyltransferase